MPMIDTATSVIEWAPFRLAAGKTEDDLLSASESFQRDFLQHQPGFIRRELLLGANGEWVDLVLWRDRASADAIMEAAASSPHCAAYFQIMDLGDNPDVTANVKHLRRIRAY
jgi:hypothetical protein